MPSSQPFITIITPTFNAGKFIQKCIESVQDQTFKNVEHLILDAESGDDTVMVIRRLQQKFDTIRLEVERDSGVFDAMNKGIQKAKAKWLYFLGADDYLYDKNVLLNISEHLQKNQSQIIYGDVFFQNLERLYDRNFDIEKILKHNICHQAIFYNASVFEIIGNYDLKYKSESDYDFNLRCWLSGRVDHRYVPITIAFYADGGLSSTRLDHPFIEDYPEKTIHIVLNGNWSARTKISILSKIYRKVLQRSTYDRSTLFQQVFKKDFFLHRALAFLWMCLSSPFYLLKKSEKIS